MINSQLTLHSYCSTIIDSKLYMVLPWTLSLLLGNIFVSNVRIHIENFIQLNIRIWDSLVIPSFKPKLTLQCIRNA